MTAQQVRCPRCSNLFLAPPGSGGQVVACPHCQGQLRVPAPVAARPAAVPPPATPPPRPPAPVARPSVAVARPVATPASPPAPPAGVPRMNSGASPVVPTINDRAQASTTVRMIHRRKANNNLVLYIAAPIAILFVMGAIGIIALVASKKSSGYDQAVKITDEMLGEMDNLATALESVKDQKTAKSAAPRINGIVDRITELYHKANKIKVTESQGKKLQQRVESRMKKLEPRMTAAATQAGVKSEGDPDFIKSMERLASLEKILK